RSLRKSFCPRSHRKPRTCPPLAGEPLNQKRFKGGYLLPDVRHATDDPGYGRHLDPRFTPSGLYSKEHTGVRPDCRAWGSVYWLSHESSFTHTWLRRN